MPEEPSPPVLRQVEPDQVEPDQVVGNEEDSEQAHRQPQRIRRSGTGSGQYQHRVQTQEEQRHTGKKPFGATFEAFEQSLPFDRISLFARCWCGHEPVNLDCSRSIRESCRRPGHVQAASERVPVKATVTQSLEQQSEQLTVATGGSADRPLSQ